MVAVALLTAFVLGDSGHAAQPGASRSAATMERTIRVGQIYIDGADDMATSAILNELNFQTGDRIPCRRLREAERRLDRLGIFVVDKANNVRPDIAELPDGEFTNLRITVVKKAKGAPR